VLSAAGILARRMALLIAVLVLVFAAVELLPGNAARAVLGRDAGAADIVAREHELGLDRPWPVRFLDWLGGLATGDLGVSARGVPVGDLIASQFPNTLLLGGLALAVTVLASVPLGLLWTARPGGRLARVLEPVSTMVIAVPEFVVATVLVLVLALWAGWFPAVTVASAAGTPASAGMLVLPVAALAIPQTGWNTRVVRAALDDASAAPHVQAAELDGLAPRRVLVRHVLPVAVPTIAASIATTVGMLLGGAVVVETIFNYPGVGSVLAGSVGDRDAPLIAAVVAMTGTTIMVVLLVADGLRAWATRGRA
jgi:peptide/nickel transport system permease protein